MRFKNQYQHYPCIILTDLVFQGQKLIGHPGYGGQVGHFDPVNQLSVGYITNYASLYGFWDDPRYLDLEAALYDSLEDYVRGEKQ